MGWGKWLGAIGAGVAGAFTGGATWAAIPGLLATGASVAGGIMENRARGKAAGEQRQASGEASSILDATVGSYAGQGQDALNPYMDAGAGQLDNMSRLSNMGPADIHAMTQMDPSFAFRRDQGQQGIERSAASKGTLLSGGTIKDTIQYNSDFAGTEYARAYDRASTGVQQQFGRAAATAGMGRSAAGQVYGTGANASAKFGQEKSNIAMGIGNVNSAETVGNANVWGNVISGAANTIGGMIAPGRSPSNSSSYNAPLTSNAPA